MQCQPFKEPDGKVLFLNMIHKLWIQSTVVSGEYCLYPYVIDKNIEKNSISFSLIKVVFSIKLTQ